VNRIKSLLAILALVGACGGCGEEPTNYQAVEAEAANERAAAANDQNAVRCADCGPAVYGPDGKIIPQG
jgi:hypothetical protein